MNAAGVVRAFWAAMSGNDRAAVADRHPAAGYEGVRPQTGEILWARRDFARVSAGFPGQDGWRFDLIELVADSDRAVTDMRVGQPEPGIAPALTFHHVGDGLIRSQREFWPEPAGIPFWRRGMLPLDPLRARF